MEILYFKMWLWTLVGLSIITKVCGYASGYFPEVCHTMSPMHKNRGEVLAPQNTQPPFEVRYEHGKKGEPITVFLKSKSSTQFRGFMLEARNKSMVDDGRPVGKFILLDARNSQLLTCGDIVGEATWLMTFDALFEGLKLELPNIIATTLTSSPFLHRLIKGTQISCCLLCTAVEISAAILYCVCDSSEVTLVALVCVMILIDLIELVILSLPIGPSHELKEICDLAVKVCSIIHMIFTIAVIFTGVIKTDSCSKNRTESWLLKVMVAYTAWILLFVIWVFVFTAHGKAILGGSKIGSLKTGEGWRQQRRKKTLSAANVIVTAVSVILVIGNMFFAAAVIAGIFGCLEK
ncbi:uncharacterized protein LOC123970940 isoform X3 [Micropterus dolomieu]|uniref:uncharacterized protein LOC123970940 isoform X3 n=1 Tax=Micropterus dolomieu TaxID=147949 RepID=UPI001E8ECBEA|nr:uncharacterized protein LOC123970940 isoform X3 [Micropterus dolomieu]